MRQRRLADVYCLNFLTFLVLITMSELKENRAKFIEVTGDDLPALSNTEHGEVEFSSSRVLADYRPRR